MPKGLNFCLSFRYDRNGLSTKQKKPKKKKNEEEQISDEDNEIPEVGQNGESPIDKEV